MKKELDKEKKINPVLLVLKRIFIDNPVLLVLKRIFIDNPVLLVLKRIIIDDPESAGGEIPELKELAKEYNKKEENKETEKMKLVLEELMLSQKTINNNYFKAGLKVNPEKLAKENQNATETYKDKINIKFKSKERDD